MKACTRHLRIRTSVCLILTVLFALTTVLCASPKKAYAGADLANPDLVPNMVVVYDNGDVFSCFSGIVKDKKAAVEILEPSSQTTKSGYERFLSARKELLCGNGNVYVTFSSTIVTSPAFMVATVTQGTSHTAWMGTLPQYNASHLQLFDSVTWNAWGSVSISKDGAGWSTTNNTSLWTGPMEYDYWEASHTFGGLTGSGILTSVVESSTGDFYFASSHSSFTPTAFQTIYY